MVVRIVTDFSSLNNLTTFFIMNPEVESMLIEKWVSENTAIPIIYMVKFEFLSPYLESIDSITKLNIPFLVEPPNSFWLTTPKNVSDNLSSFLNFKLTHTRKQLQANNIAIFLAYLRYDFKNTKTKES